MPDSPGASPSSATAVDDATLAAAQAEASQLVLVRTHGAYSLFPVDSAAVPAPASLNGNSYLVRAPRIVALAELPAAVRGLLESAGGDAAVGLFVSSVEVIAHLKAAGIELPKAPKGAPRAAVVTTVMVKSKRNPLPDSHDHFFVGWAEGPRCGAAPVSHEGLVGGAERIVGAKAQRASGTDDATSDQKKPQQPGRTAAAT